MQSQFKQTPDHQLLRTCNSKTARAYLSELKETFNDSSEAKGENRRGRLSSLDGTKSGMG